MALTRHEARLKPIMYFGLFILMIQLYQSGEAKSIDDNFLDEAPRTRLRLRRILRDTSGHYHPELHGDGAFQGQGQFQSIHVHSHGGTGRQDGAVSSISASSSNLVDSNNEVHHHEEVFGVPSTLVRTGPSGYAYPIPPPPVDNGPTPGGAPNCGCELAGRCAKSQKGFTDFVIQTRGTTTVCGRSFELCCFDDPWPGVVDNFLELAPCVPVEICARAYGVSPTDVRDFGVIGPCPGLGSVRCLDNKVPVPPSPPQQPQEPIHIVIPIIEHPVEPEPPVPTTVYEPPVVYTTPEPVTNPPTQPPGGYDLPVPETEPPVVYNPPVIVTEPPVVYNPPVPVTEPPVVYNPPAPVTEPPVVYNPPVPVTEPPVVYNPPAPVTEPPVVYNPPTPVIEPPVVYNPPVIYGPPAPVIEQPVVPPSTSYGVPGVPVGQPFGYGGRRFGGYPYAGFGGYGRGFGGAYPYYNNGLGFGFRKHIGFSKGFGFYG